MLYFKFTKPKKRSRIFRLLTLFLNMVKSFNSRNACRIKNYRGDDSFFKFIAAVLNEQ
jgi:hypothetical protein